jgi:hypothetical protein
LATEEELDEIETRIVESIDAGAGSISVDGMSASEMDPRARLDVLERLRHRNAEGSGNLLGRLFRHTVRLVPPGGSGR